MERHRDQLCCVRELSVPKERCPGKVDLRRCPHKQGRSLDGVEAVQAQGGIFDQLPAVERAHLVYREVGWAGGSGRVHLPAALDRQQLSCHCRIIYYLDLGAEAISAQPNELGIEHKFELFEGFHAGVQHRYPLALRFLAARLTEEVKRE
jgi:hypothetical protein